MKFGVGKANYNEKLEAKRQTVLALAETISTDGEQKAQYLKELREFRLMEAKDFAEKSYYRRIVEAEKEFYQICYRIAKANSKINGTPLTPKDIENMSVFDFYVLKNNLENDFSKNG